MTLEHVRDPSELVRQAHLLLRPGGQFVSVTHDYRAPLNRVLGRRSPIIDIEHLQLFSQRSIAELFSRAGYDMLQSASFTNAYAIDYWLRLTPLPVPIKTAISRGIGVLGLAEWRLAFNVGNIVTVASKQL